MKKMLAALMLTACLAVGAVGEEYQNPILIWNDQGKVMDAADPFIMRFNGKYYLYPTGGHEIRAYESSDLIHWDYKGEITQGGKVHIAYAPEVFYWRGDFYLITSPLGNGHYILKSDNPLGPFEPVTENFGYSIDGSLFALDQGELWMFCLNSNTIKQTKINEDTLRPEGVMISTTGSLNGWTEGPGLIRRGEWNYLTFCGNHYLSTGYRVAWASRKGDMVGRYTQREDSTLLINSVSGARLGGLGHSSNFYGPDLESIYTSYHCHSVYGNGNTRYYCLDRLLTNGGVLYSTGPSDGQMPVPAMPEAYGDLQGDGGHFEKGTEGAFAQVTPSMSFTQECNLILNGGTAAWKMGSRDGRDALIATDGKTISFMAGDQVIAQGPVPELGRQGRIHTLRIEHTKEKMYVSIDTMRVLTVEDPGVTADTVGALFREGADYSFIAHTGKALGEGDYTALKVMPGKFAAVHCLEGSEITAHAVNDQEEMAAVLGTARYNVRVQQEGAYRFDLKVPTQDVGKEITFTVGDQVMTARIPAYQGKKKAEWFTFTTPEIMLPKGDHILTLQGDQVSLTMAEGYLSAAMPESAWDFADGKKKGIISLGMVTVKEGALSIPAYMQAFALIGKEGCTDYEMQVSFKLPKKGIGSSGFLMRATEVSLFENNLKDSYFGYSISVSPIGLNVRRIRYGASGGVEFVTIKEWSGKEEGQLILRARGNQLSIYLPGAEEALLTLEDASPFTHGLCGLFSTGKELMVTDLSVKPLED